MRKRTIPSRRGVAARKIQKVWRGAIVRKRRLPPLARATKRAKLHIGTRMPIARKSKTRVTGTNAGSIDTRALYVQSVTDIPFGTGINERAKDNVRIKGFKIRGELRNSQETQLIVFRMAIVASKNANLPTATNFLKGYDTDNGLTLGTARSGIQNCMYGINEREFSVVWQKTIRLAPRLANNASTIYDNTKAQRKVSAYVKLNRTLQWDSAVDADPASDRLFFVYWCDNPVENAGGASILNAMYRGYEIVTYFNDAN